MAERGIPKAKHLQEMLNRMSPEDLEKPIYLEGCDCDWPWSGLVQRIPVDGEDRLYLSIGR